MCTADASHAAEAAALPHIHTTILASGLGHIRAACTSLGCEQGVDSLDACSIGQALMGAESGIGSPVDAFQGQMGAVHLFDDVITARTPWPVYGGRCGMIAKCTSSSLLVRRGS